MKKMLIISIFLLLKMNVSGQVRWHITEIPDSILEHLSEMGKEDYSILTKHESDYFNIIFKEARVDFDFTGKKIGFIMGQRKTNKIDYFNQEKKWLARDSITVSESVETFDKDQKFRSGGYDAVIVYWSKRVIPVEDLIRILRLK